MTRLVATIVFSLMVCMAPADAGDIASHRIEAMAVENIELARAHCGYEITAQAARLISVDRQTQPRPFAEPRATLANLWRQTWTCNSAFIGESCMAARLQLCHRAYAEYGPDGIRIAGLIRAIIKK